MKKEMQFILNILGLWIFSTAILIPTFISVMVLSISENHGVSIPRTYIWAFMAITGCVLAFYFSSRWHRVRNKIEAYLDTLPGEEQG